MATDTTELDVAELLAPLSDDAPCGESLAYDPQYFAVDMLLAPAESGMIEGKEAEEPNWRQIHDASVTLLKRTKDLHLIVHVIVSELALRGYGGMAAGLALLRQALERYWETIHPQLDPEDDHDPTQRMNIIATLTSLVGPPDPVRFLSRLTACPIVASRQLGPVSLRTLQQVRGESPVDGEKSQPQMSDVEAVLRDVGPDEIERTYAIVGQALADVEAIDTFLTGKVGHGQAPNFTELRRRLAEAKKLLEPFAAPQSVAEAADAGADAGAVAAAGDGASDGGDRQEGAVKGLDGEVRSTQDVLRAIDKICAFYAAHEPSSPVPLLLNRARKLVGKEFLHIVEDLAPKLSSTMRELGGLDEGDKG